ncbi:MAG: glycosyltransferase family 2 protein [Lautropia sp.]
MTVIVPTYRRPDDLQRCLAGLAAQRTAPLEILVVLRADDTASAAVVADWQPRFTETAIDSDPPAGSGRLRLTHPDGVGVVAAYNAGLAAAAGEVVAFLDDDAVPAPDWVERLALAYRDPQVAGVGGKDRLYRQGVRIDGVCGRVGRLQWFGRHIGNHHLGAGEPRSVDVLKGVNMSFRRAALGGHRFDTRLRGPGAQPDCELMFCLALRRQGWRLVYDPAILVDHYTAARHDIDQREGFNAQALGNHAHNETLAVLTHGPWWRRLAFALWAVALGSRSLPGLLHAPRLFWLGLDHPGARIAAALSGRWSGLWIWCKPEPAPFARSMAR